MVQGSDVGEFLRSRKRNRFHLVGFCCSSSSHSSSPQTALPQAFQSKDNLDLYAAFVPPRRQLKKRRLIEPISVSTYSHDEDQTPLFPSVPTRGAPSNVPSEDNDDDKFPCPAPPRVFGYKTNIKTEMSNSNYYYYDHGTSHYRSQPFGYYHQKNTAAPAASIDPYTNKTQKLMRNLLSCMKQTEKSRSKLFLHRQRFSRRFLEASDKVLHMNATRKKLIWTFEEALGEVPSVPFVKNNGTASSSAASTDDDHGDDDDDDDVEDDQDYDEFEEYGNDERQERAELSKKERQQKTNTVSNDQQTTNDDKTTAAPVSPHTSPQQSQRTALSPKYGGKFPCTPSSTKLPSSPSSSSSSPRRSLVSHSSPNPVRGTHVHRPPVLVRQHSPDRRGTSPLLELPGRRVSDLGVVATTVSHDSSSPCRGQGRRKGEDSSSGTVAAAISSPGRVSLSSDPIGALDGEDSPPPSQRNNLPLLSDFEVPRSIIRKESLQRPVQSHR